MTYQPTQAATATQAVAPAGDPPAAPQFEAELRVLFRKARELFRATAADIHPELNVSGYATLMRVIEEGPLRAVSLVDYFGTDKGSMSRQLAHLEKIDLVRRTKDPDDGRAQMIAATPDAVRRTALARERSRARLRQRISGWEAERLETFTALLHEFNAALGREPVASPDDAR